MVMGRCPMVPLRCPMVPVRCVLTTVYCQRVLHCKKVPSHLKQIFKQLGPGVLTKSNTEKRGQLIHSVPMSTRRQPSNPRLRLGLLGCQLGEIGMKLHSVQFAVKFSSALALENFTAKCTLCNFISSRTNSNQVGLSPISIQPRLATLDSANLRLDLCQLGWTYSDLRPSR